jgi:hypothetical protein
LARTEVARERGSGTIFASARALPAGFGSATAWVSGSGSNAVS